MSKSIKFPEVTQTIAENQDEYQTVHVQFDEKTRSVGMCFKLSKKEIAEIVRTGVLWYKQVIPKGQMNPMKISGLKHDIIFVTPEIIKSENQD